jgi:glycolate oxidase iron-sulfur subunit
MKGKEVRPLDQTKTLQQGAFRGVDVPSYTDILNCMHCGLCLPTCPTYALTGRERSSPRGRIALIRAIADGELEITERFAEEMYFCLGCRACETACPAGVKYGELLEAARVQIEQTRRGRGVRRVLREAIFGAFLVPERLHRLGKLLRLYQRSGLQWLARRTGALRLLPGDLATLEQFLPPLPKRFSHQTIPPVVPPVGSRRARVGMLLGCVMDLFCAAENEATVRVLARNGCEVVTPRQQRCCGALHAHAGEMAQARQLARHNIRVFEESGVEAVVINSAGCGAAMKSYGHWLQDDPEWAERARRFSARVKDFSEFLVDLGLNTRDLQPLPIRATYHDACHLAHGQKVVDPPRQILQAIPGLQYVELPEADWCCGSAGIYNITHFETSLQLLDRKMEHLRGTGTGVVVTGNPGCLLQLRFGLRRHRLDMEAVHTATLLDRAYAPPP